MGRIGIGGLVCGLIGFILEILVFLIPLITVLTFNIFLLLLMPVFQWVGLILGILGLILGIVGTAKDEARAPGIVGLIFGAIAIFIAVSPFLLGITPFYMP